METTKATGRYKLLPSLKPLETITPPNSKRCNKCGEVKSMDEYAKARNKDGKKNTCSKCVNEALRAARKERLENFPF